MSGDNEQADDRGTILEPVAHLREAWSGGAQPPAGTRLEPRSAGLEPAASGLAAEPAHRPTIRPLVPRLTLLDDGEDSTGETIRLRDAFTVIGRTEGQIRLPHDPLVSGRHAEILREGSARPHSWWLRDLGSSNGTFVRCLRTILRPESLVMLGGRRFRFRPPPSAIAADAGERCGTLAVDVAGLQAGVWPTLVETGQAAGGLELALTGTDLSLGRPGLGNQVEIDDPQLAPRHARILRDDAGRWLMEALPSRNGVWAQVAVVRLSSECRFQIGEQRFLFALE